MGGDGDLVVESRAISVEEVMIVVTSWAREAVTGRCIRYRRQIKAAVVIGRYSVK